MKRIALGLQYDGAAFNGWQTQLHGNTVQDCLQRALHAFVGEPVAVTVAGRTDTGVHALGQVAHIDVAVERSIFSWVRGLNSFLPSSVVVQWAQEVDTNFHARFTAYERTYFYALYCHSIRPPLLHSRAGYLMLPPEQQLDCAAMRQAAQHLIGEHDFSAFRAAACQAKSPVKTMHEIEIREQGNWIFVKFRANAFLHHMVRNLMGSLIAVGRGRDSVDGVRQLLEHGDRSKAAPTFMPDGLYLANVAYPIPYTLPSPNLTASLFNGVFA